MKEYFSLLRQCPLFAGIEEDDMGLMLRCLDSSLRTVEKDAPIFLEGDPARWVGVVLTGAVQVLREDYYGNRSVMAALEPGGLFGEVFACAGIQTLPVSVFASKDSTVLLLDCRRVLTLCSNNCRFHSHLVQNLLQVVARKNLMLNRKLQIMSQKTTREKLMAYLLEQAKGEGRGDFTIPLDRQALADYLGVDRSAMSAELSKLRREGVLESKGSYFRLLGEHAP